MKKCNSCGSQLPNTYNACPNCGNTNLVSDQSMNNQQYGQPVYNQPMYNQQQVQQKGSFGWAVLGFFIPLVGLILYLVWKDEKPGDAKSAGKGALVSVIVSVVFSILYAIFIFAVVASAV